MLLPEVLLLLAGHPSALFRVDWPSDTPAANSLATAPTTPWTYTLRDLPVPLHPGEVDTLNHLGRLAARFVRVRTFCQRQLSLAKAHTLRKARQRFDRKGKQPQRPSPAAASDAANDGSGPHELLAPLCTAVLDILDDYLGLVLDTEADVLREHPSIVDLASARDPSSNRGGATGEGARNARRPFVSLASLRARFSGWEPSLGALDSLVHALQRGPGQPRFLEEPSEAADKARRRSEQGVEDAPHLRPRPCAWWPPGLLLDMLSRRAEAGIAQVANHLTRVLHACEDAWKRGLVAWMCYGIAAPSMASVVSHLGPFAALVERRTEADDEEGREGDLDDPEREEGESGWRFVPQALPSSVTDDGVTGEAILSVGRALAMLAASADVDEAPTQRTPKCMPDAVTQSLAARLLQAEVRPSDAAVFCSVVREVRDEIAEWMWRNVLTPVSVIDAIEALGGYFLHRRGLFISSFLRELSTTRRRKLLDGRSAVGASIQPRDVELAWYRASAGTDSEDDPHLDLCRVVPSKRLRREAQAASAALPASAGLATGGEVPLEAARFDDMALGAPLSLVYTAHFPLDLFLTSADLRNYSAVFAYLLSIKATQTRLRGCWMTMAKQQRLRRRFTGTGEGGASVEEEKERGELLRMAWGTAREALWFLEALVGHFQTDIIDVQTSRLLDQLQVARGVAAPQPGEYDGVGSEVEGHAGSSGADGVSAAEVAAVAGSSSPRLGASPEHSPGSAKPPLPASSTRAGTASRLGARHAAAASVAGSARSRKPSGVLGGGGGGGGGARRSGAPASFGAPTTALSLGGGGVGTAGGSTGGGGGGGGVGSADCALDFASLRAIHGAYLGFVLDGLLLTSPAAAGVVRSTLATCDGFVGMVERWGGDVLPDLLMEGSILGHGVGGDVGASVRQRRVKVQEAAQVLRGHIVDFFTLLTSASDGVAPTTQSGDGHNATLNDASLGSLSVHVPQKVPLLPRGATLPGTRPSSTTAAASRAAGAGGATSGGTKEAQQQQQQQQRKADEAKLDADSAARRHLEQLLLRLDYNDFLGRHAHAVVSA